MDKFSVNSSTKFTVLEELNSEFTLVKIKVMATGKNRNMSYFGKDVVEAHLNSLNYAPVVAHLFKDENGEYKIGGHDMYIDWEDWSVKSLCVHHRERTEQVQEVHREPAVQDGRSEGSRHSRHQGLADRLRGCGHG